MTPRLTQLLDTSIMSAIAAGVAKAKGDCSPEGYKTLMDNAQVAYKELTDYLEVLEANQRNSPPPDFYRRDQEPIGADPTMAGAVRYTR